MSRKKGTYEEVGYAVVSLLAFFGAGYIVISVIDLGVKVVRTINAQDNDHQRIYYLERKVECLLNAPNAHLATGYCNK